MRDPFLQALSAKTSLPKAVKDVHSRPGTYKGRCVVETGTGLINSMLLRVGRFPAATAGVPISVSICCDGLVWTWVRRFGQHQMLSRIMYDNKKNLVFERIGGISIWLRPVERNSALVIEITKLRFLGIPCPLFLVPQSNSIEWQDEQGRFNFEISAEIPVLGPIIRYHGYLEFLKQEDGRE